MSWQIIHDDDVAATEGWCEALLDVREEDGAVHRSINHEGSDNPVVAQAGDESDCFPMSMRNRCDQPLPARAKRPLSRTMFVLVAVSSINTSRAGSSMPCSRIQRRRTRATSARFCSAACRLFLKLTLCRSKKRWRALRLPGMPCLAMTARISSRVKSGCLAIRAKIQSECSSNGETLPPLRFGAALPVSLQRWHHRITELTPTLNISAISRRDPPLSTASTARSRKSVEYGLGIDLAPQANQFPQIRLGDSGWESLRFNADGKCSSTCYRYVPTSPRRGGAISPGVPVTICCHACN